MLGSVLPACAPAKSGKAAQHTGVPYLRFDDLAILSLDRPSGKFNLERTDQST
eukprot:SAG31_NODE_5457_length_2526_cov_1.346930_4_plen_52_part_01